MGNELNSNFYKFSFTDDIVNTVRKNESIILIGSPQTGKTTSYFIVQEQFPEIKNNYEYIDLNDHEKFMENIKKLKNILNGNVDSKYFIEANEYHIECIHNYNFISSEEDINKNTNNAKSPRTIKTKLINLFKKKEEWEKVPDDYIRIQKISININNNEVNYLFDYFLKKLHPAKALFGNETRKSIIEESSIIESYKDKSEIKILLPGLLETNINNYNEKQQLNKSNEYYTSLSLIFGLTSASIIKDNLPVFIDLASQSLLTVFGIAGLVALPIFALINFRSEKREGGIERFIKAYSSWNNLPEEKKEFISNKMDKKYHFTPGTSYKFLKKWFGDDKDEFKSNIEEQFNQELIDKINDIVDTKLKDFKDEIDKEINDINNKIIALERRVTQNEKNIDKLNLDRITTGCSLINNENDLKKQLKITNSDNELLGNGDSNEDNEIKTLIKDIIKKSEDNTVIITGEPGAGKTVLLYLATKELLNQNKKLYYVNAPSEFLIKEFNSLNNTYAIIDFNDQNSFNNFINETQDLGGYFISKRIIATARNNYINGNNEIKYVFKDISYDDGQLKKIAEIELIKNNALKIDKNCIGKWSSILSRKSERIPLYIKESIKLLEINNFDENVLNNLPDGIEKLIKEILTEECNKDIKNLIIYKEVAESIFIPESFLYISMGFLNIVDRPAYLQKEGLDYSLHSWYKDAIQSLENKKWKIENLENKTFNINFKDELDEIGNAVNKFNFNNSENIKNSFGELKRILKPPVNMLEKLDDLSGLLILLSTLKFIGNNLKQRDQRIGYDILNKKIDYRDLDISSIEKYKEISVFLLRSVFSNTNENDLKNNTFIELLIIFSSRIFTNYFLKYLREFIFDNNVLEVSQLLQIKMSLTYPIIQYVKAFAYLLRNENIVHIDYPEYLFLIGNYKDAIIEYDKAIELNPDDPGGHNNKGLTLGHLGNYKDAIIEYDKAIKLNPDGLGYYNNKGNALYALGNYKDAIIEYDKAIKLNPDEPVYHYIKGLALANKNDYDNALFEIDIAIKFNPIAGDFWISKAELFAIFKKKEKGF